MLTFIMSIQIRRDFVTNHSGRSAQHVYIVSQYIWTIQYSTVVLGLVVYTRRPIRYTSLALVLQEQAVPISYVRGDGFNHKMDD